MDTLWQDVKYGARMLLKNRLATMVAVLTLALGIGATTSIFTIANELLLRPRPGIGAPEELVDIGRSQHGQGFDNVSYPNFADFRARNTSFTDVLGCLLEPRSVSLSTGDSSERIYASVVSGNFFSVLQVKPARGRFFTAEDDNQKDPHAVTVLSHAFWQRNFAGDMGIVGRDLKINGQSFTVVGVAPEDFRGTLVLAPDAWFPMAMSPVILPGSRLLTSRASVWMVAMGRLKPGVTLKRAQAEAFAIGAQLEKEFPKENEGRNFALYPSRLFPGQLQTYVAGFLAVLMVIVGLILMIVCVNVAGILLVRATARQREIAVRLALGAGKSRILRQLLTEGVLLFLLGGGAGLLVAVWVCDAILRMIPALPFPVSLELHVDWRVLLFALGVSLVAGILSALAPALHVARPNVVTALKDESQGSGLRKLRLRNAPVLGQVALSLVLLVCAGLFLRALGEAKTLNPGFDVANVQMVELNFSLAGYKEDDGIAANDQLLSRVRALPGVTGAALAWGLPLDGSGRALGGIRVPGRELPPGRSSLDADWNVVTPGYFATMRIALMRGRDFTEADRAGAQEVVIINEMMANRFWPGEDPVGRVIEAGDFGPLGRPEENRHLTIIGVARDHKYRSLGDEARLFVYVPQAQNFRPEVSMVVRTAPGVPAIFPAVRSVIHELNPALPVLHAQSLAEYTSIGLLPQRIAGWLSGSLGTLGLLLTGMGIYGIIAFSVGQRTREIGIRIALGASQRDILRMILRAGFTLAAIGMGIGLVLSFVAAPLLGGLLIGVSAQDPITFLGVAAVMSGVALAACYIPARRATKVSPIVALRYE
jgi:predicted permease